MAVRPFSPAIGFQANIIINATGASTSASIQSGTRRLRIVNGGAGNIFYRLGTGSATATTADTALLAGTAELIALGTEDTIAVISSSTSTVYVSSEGGSFTSPLLDLIFQSNTAYQNGVVVPMSSVLSTTRASIGYAFTNAGVAVQFAANTSRITDAGDTVEPARTNDVLQNTDLSNASWSFGTAGMTRTAGQASPDGATGATLINNGTGTGNHDAVASSISWTTATAYTQTIYVKPGTGRYYQILLSTTVAAATNFANYDTTTDTVTASAGITSASISAIGGGWHKLLYTLTTTGTASSAAFIGAIVPASNTARQASFTGASETMTVWAPQRDIAATGSSPILTTTISVTRAADAAQIQITGIVRVVFTFTNGTTQTVTGIDPATMYTIPTNLNFPVIQRLTGYSS